MRLSKAIMWQPARGRYDLSMLIATGVLLTCMTCGRTDEHTRNPWSTPLSEMMLAGHTGAVIQSVFSSDGTMIGSVSADSTAVVWSAETGTQIFTLRGHQGGLRSIVFLPENGGILTFADDFTIIGWDTQDGSQRTSIKLPQLDEKISCATFSHDGSLLAVGFNARAEVFETVTGQLLHVLGPTGHPGLRVPIQDIKFRPDDRQVALAAYSHDVSVWNLRDSRRHLNLHGHGRAATTVAFSPDMNYLISGSREKSVFIWDARRGVLVDELLPGWEVQSVAVSPDGTTLVVTERAPRGQVARAGFWDLGTRNLIARMEDFGPVCNLSFSPGGNRLAVPAGNRVKVLNVAPGSTPSINGGGGAIPAPQKNGIENLVKTATTAASSMDQVSAVAELFADPQAHHKVASLLAFALNSESPTERMNAAVAAAELGFAAPVLISSLVDRLETDDDADVMAAAALALGCLGDIAGQAVALDELIKALSDKSPKVRYHAAHALDKVAEHAPEVLPQLVEAMLHDPTYGIRRMIAFNLGNGGAASLPALPRLIAGIESNSERELWWSCYGLWCIAAAVDSDAVVALPALKSAVLSASNFRDENGGPPRKYAMHGVGAIGPAVIQADPELIPILGDIMINDDDYYHRKAAALALENILAVKGLRQKVRGYVRKPAVNN